MLFLWILAALICTMVGHSMGEKRSIGATNGAIIGLLLGPIGLMILLLYPEIKSPKTSATIPYTQATQTIEPATPVATTPGAQADELKKWHDLYTNGVINEEEFQAQKKKILGN